MKLSKSFKAADHLNEISVLSVDAVISRASQVLASCARNDKSKDKSKDKSPVKSRSRSPMTNKSLVNS